ncbi:MULTISPECIES: tol-pal system protein YbgF [Rhodanobacter]|uniref:tol-pal system protein YbgF n=1 Tax=Rhodanobacter TaxID=75309 RepID=UPI000260D4E6|nr:MULTISPECIES: tol-pal system protein YbgF [Rhodanobacter]EIM04858.1 tol-pal system protein YbgF [Rhodanobacter denitrificans]KZC19917.1 tol-pal system protein [Rhodanobacter denitrificans]UJJ51791.1 tol-pal system protein YbgF [Rhodanobacter denitrificans]UJJ59434.1 tol-pal system protein YbgF [Rhodanobacter denitrificans]UJM89898.1 tol-pal system protein YbgF [Rhodanobacter denitrificans]
MAGAIASAMLFAFPAFAQDSRLSLADRVARLEQQAQNKDQSGTGLVNQMQQLQAQVQQLQGQVEELQHQLQTLDDKNKAQYTDLDARLGRLEGGRAGAAAASGSNPQAQAGNPAAAASVVAAANPAAGRPAANAGSNTATAGDPAAAQTAYDVAFKAIRAGNYVEASREFRSFIQQYPNHALAPNAWYWLGESYYATTNYPVALESFQQLLSQFPQSDKAPDALLKVGYSQLELKQTAAAKATLTQVASKYPGSKAASLAQERLQRLQLQSGN